MKTSRKDSDKSKASLDEQIQDQEPEEHVLTETELGMLRKVLEKQMENLFDRLETIAIRLGRKVKAIKDLTSSPTKFQEDRRNAPEILKMSSSEKEWETFSKWRKGIDRYVTDCYKSDSNAIRKPQCVKAAMTSYMDQKWKDLVQVRLDKATSVKQMDEVMAVEMDVIWPKYKKNESYYSNQSKTKKQTLSI